MNKINASSALALTIKKLFFLKNDASNLEIICFLVFWTAITIQLLLIFGVEAILQWLIAN